jgi:hypothetical protein
VKVIDTVVRIFDITDIIVISYLFVIIVKIDSDSTRIRCPLRARQWPYHPLLNVPKNVVNFLAKILVKNCK